MAKPLIPTALIVTALLGLIAYSKWNPPPQRASGLVQADEIRLGSRVGGRVARVHVQEGEEVSSGTVLIELEPYDLLEREKQLELELAVRQAEYERFQVGFRAEEIAQAQAKLAQLQARLDLLKAGPREQEVKAAQGRVDVAQAERKLAEEGFQRMSKLAKSNATSLQELDKARESLEAAKAAFSVRQQELELLEAGTREEELREAAARVEEASQAVALMQNGYRREEIQQAKASRDAAKAALDAIGKQTAELVIKSPANGTIEALDLQPGDMVPPNAPVVSLLDRTQFWIRAYVPQNQPRLQIGQSVPISIDGYPDEVFVGTITFIARHAEFTPSNVQTPEERSKQVCRIKVALNDDDEQRLRPGMMVDLWLDQLGDEK
ncbi:HlyD family secretion protein [Stieleria varia]|uniref:Multidrug export protein EmrA n=1 Tax=Stieleria varia TaxID=2528005 RepID=A0A5C6AFW2_9BACT|nr:HlyD family efflux transporter periplasmic adaptor subunit [Stieleria varia]TWT98489.1 Multidrug export protein EmrA [Stieleria varia]